MNESIIDTEEADKRRERKTKKYHAVLLLYPEIEDMMYNDSLVRVVVHHWLHDPEDKGIDQLLISLIKELYRSKTELNKELVQRMNTTTPTMNL